MLDSVDILQLFPPTITLGRAIENGLIQMLAAEPAASCEFSG